MDELFDFGCGERDGLGDKLGKYFVNVVPSSSQNWAADSWPAEKAT